eukprot:495455-Rhodomonas_salina.1
MSACVSACLSQREHSSLLTGREREAYERVSDGTQSLCDTALLLCGIGLRGQAGSLKALASLLLNAAAFSRIGRLCVISGEGRSGERMRKGWTHALKR